MADEIIKVLNELSKKFGIAIDWSNKNILPYIEDLGSRIVKYEFITSILWITFTLLLLCICIVITKKMYIKKENDLSFQDMFDFFNFSVTVLSVLSVLTILLQIPDIIKCLIIPEHIICDTIKYLM